MKLRKIQSTFHMQNTYEYNG